MPYAERNAGICHGKLWPALPIIGLTAILIAAAGSKPAGKIILASYSEPEPVAGQESRQSTFDHFGIWIASSRETLAKVRDYQGTLSKRERVDGILQEDQTATIKVRTQPFSVYLKFVAPKASAGKEASYVLGRHNGKMKAKSGGALGLVGYVTVDPHDSRAMHGTRHSITEAGLGNLIDRLSQAYSASKSAGRAEPAVAVAEYTIHQRPCVRFEVTDPAADGTNATYRTVVYFDRDTNLPVRYEAYDQRGELVESFAYIDLRFNVGLTDAAFP